MALLDARNRNDVRLVHLRQRVPASVVQRQLTHTVLAAVPVAVIGVAAVLDELGELVVEDAAVRADVAPVPVELLHHVAGSQALVVVDFQVAVVEALDFEGGCGGAEGHHSAPGGAGAFHGVRAVGGALDGAVWEASGSADVGFALLVFDGFGVGVPLVRAVVPVAAGTAPEAVDWGR